MHLYLHALEHGGETYVFADEDGVPAWRRGRSGAGPARGRGRGAGMGPGPGTGPVPGAGPGPHGCCGCCREECARRGA